MDNNNDSTWWQQKANEPAPQVKWYNNKSKLQRSVLIWPVLLYGLIRTDLINQKVKIVVGGLLFMLFAFAINESSNYNGGTSARSPSAASQDPWDHSIKGVEYYLKHHYLIDPDSYEGISWTQAVINADGTSTVSHTFRAKNSYGGMVEETKSFTIDKDGWTVLSVY